METKTVYRYDLLEEEHKLIEQLVLDDTDRSPFSGEWQIPAGCTEVEPPASKEGYHIVWDGEAWQYAEDKDHAAEEEKEPTLEELKERKIASLKAARDAAEEADITYNGNTYDFDEKSRERLDIAYKALSLQEDGATIAWTMADNSTADITKEDIIAVFAAAAVRSNELHIKYRELKEQVEAATTAEEVAAVTFE